MVLMTVKQIAETYDKDLESNLSWIKKTFKVDDEAISFRGRDVNAKIIVIPKLEVLADFQKDPSSDIKLFNEYKSDMWHKIGIFSLYHFYFKPNRVVIGIRRKNELRTTYGKSGHRTEEDYEYMEE